MSIRPAKKLVSIILLLSLLLIAMVPSADACGPFSRYAVFTYSKHPDLPPNKYASGQLGILQPDYARSYLVVAYRLINGGKFSVQEQDVLRDLWTERLTFGYSADEEGITASWLAARKKVPGVGEQPGIVLDRRFEAAQYNYFNNCLEDSFKTAAKTLEERIAKFGAASPEVKEWTLAQDTVFVNCGSGESIPDANTAVSESLIKADRVYQIAAANFYATKFDEAVKQFDRIAEDSSSPWREEARYVAARSLVRKASLGDEKDRKALLTEAEARLTKLLSDESASAMRDSVRRMLSLVGLRLRPAERLRELSQVLSSNSSSQTLKQDLWDYTVLVDKYLGESDEIPDENLKKTIDAAGRDDMTDWVVSFQTEPAAGLEHSLERWQKTGNLAWMISALSKVDSKNAKTPELILAADRVDPSSPAYATAQFHLARLLTEGGDLTGARRRLDDVLRNSTALPPSALNLFRHQRMMLAESLDDFLEFAQRQPAAFSWDEDGHQMPIDLKDDEELKEWAGRTLLDVDAVTIMNQYFPLEVLRDSINSKSLPKHIRRQIALAAWTRSVVLDNEKMSVELAPQVAMLAPELKPSIDSYLAAKSSSNRKAAALYTILKFPGLAPYTPSSFGRLTPLHERDIYRENWWCGGYVPGTDEDEGDESEADSTSPATPPPPPLVLFLNNVQRASAKAEHDRLLAAGAAPSYLSREVIEWANKTPADARIAESLYIVVKATRYGCTDSDNGKSSKAAFDLLHKRYPRSPWAKKTPYWFGG
jgi:tetratricopeptide (TPR) repeat protein